MTIYQTLEEAREDTSGEHVHIVCTCGATLLNCRCWSPNKLKVEVQNGCDACKSQSIQ